MYHRIGPKRKQSEPQADRKRRRVSPTPEQEEESGKSHPARLCPLHEVMLTGLRIAPANRSTRRARGSLAASTSTPVASSSRGSKLTNKPLEVLHSTINTLKGYSLFAEPVTDRQAEGYSKVVHESQDLKTIRSNIRNGTITMTDEYERAIYLMFANAVMYNLPGSAAANDAKEVRASPISSPTLIASMPYSRLFTPSYR